VVDHPRSDDRIRRVQAYVASLHPPANAVVGQAAFQRAMQKATHDALFDRAKVGTRVVVLPGGAPPANTASASAAPSPAAGPAAAAAPGGPAQAQLAPVPGAQQTVVPPLPAPVTVR